MLARDITTHALDRPNVVIIMAFVRRQVAPRPEGNVEVETEVEGREDGSYGASSDIKQRVTGSENQRCLQGLEGAGKGVLIEPWSLHEGLSLLPHGLQPTEVEF